MDIQFNGQGELSLVLSKVSDLLHEVKLYGHKSHTTISEYCSCFMLNVMVN